MKRFWGAVWLTALLALAVGAGAEGLTVAWTGANTGATARVSVIDGQSWLFLPSACDPTALALHFDGQGALTVAGDKGAATVREGEIFDLTALAEPTEGIYALTLTDEGGGVLSLYMMFSANVRAMFLLSDDPAEQGRQWVEASEDHSASAAGSAVLLRADGSVAYSGGLRQLRGRGNSTWLCDKRPYQIKLTEDADLLDTGNGAEANQTWVLLSECYDGTLLHNRVTYALARQLGIAATPSCEPVDMYYDGEYRGVYSLTEKTEVGHGRVELTDYEKLLNKMNRRMNIDLDALPQETSATEAGNALHYTVGMEDGGVTDLGGYLLEIDKMKYETEKSWFTLTNGVPFVLSNPEYASRAMVEAAARQMQTLEDTLRGYGVNETTGAVWDSLIDVEGWVKFFALNEFTKNPDVWCYASTYFTIPAGGGPIGAGPIWDFDLAYLNQTGTRYEAFHTPEGLAQRELDWGAYLYRIPAFQKLAQAYWADTLAPLVNDVLLGDENAQRGELHSLAWYWNEMAACRRMNAVLWPVPDVIDNRVVADTPEGNYALFREFIETRTQWLTGELAGWPGDAPASAVTITLDAPYGNVAGRTDVVLDDIHANAVLKDFTVEQISEATAEDYAVYEAEITLAPKLDIPFADELTATVNGVEVACECHEDGTATLTARYEDPSYRPAEYDGTDYGLVFDAEYYAQQYPEVAEEVGDDPEALLEYYVDWGIDEGHAANRFFDPQQILERIEGVADMLGEDYEEIVNFYLEAGYEDWMSELGKVFEPKVLEE